MVKKLSVLFLFYLIFNGLNGNITAQTLYFCTDVDGSGYPVNESTSFTISQNGGWVYFLTRLPFDYDCNFVIYEIDKVDKNGKETFTRKKNRIQKITGDGSIINILSMKRVIIEY